MPPPRGRDGAFDNLNWDASVFVDDDSRPMLVDATFPLHFDDHISALDAAGVLHFWSVASGVTTTFATKIYDAKAFCFGAERQRTESFTYSHESWALNHGTGWGN